MDNTYKLCELCKAEFSSEDDFHLHLKTHKISREAYYTTYFPRKDLLTGEPIPFKNKDYYFSRSFLTRQNMAVWFSRQTRERQQDFCREALSWRKDRKGIVWAPTQVEARSIMIPAVSTMQLIFDDYYKTCEELGFKNKYRLCNNLVSHVTWNGQPKIFVDTREQKPLFFLYDTEVKKLDYGDYAFIDQDWTKKCHIERKSFTDFIGTCGVGLERFKNEIERAGKDSANLVVLVEETLSSCLEFNLIAGLPSGIKATPEYIFKNVRDIIQGFPFVQFLFVNGRKEAARVIEKLFEYGSLHVMYDLQYIYDKKLL